MKLIVGLGNPGLSYSGSRHNVGFEIVKALAKSVKIYLKKEKGIKALVGKGLIGSSEIMLALPLTFMNLSGEAVKLLVKNHKVKLVDILVVCDDLDLEFGRIKIRAAGSSAGHRGIESIINHLDSLGFSRLRVGIGRPQHKEASDFVLSRFNRKEKSDIPRIINKAVICCKEWVEGGITLAMNNFNRKDQ